MPTCITLFRNAEEKSLRRKGSLRKGMTGRVCTQRHGGGSDLVDLELIEFLMQALLHVQAPNSE